MRDIRWSKIKSRRLKKVRGVSFEEIIQSQWVTIIEHPSRKEQALILFKYKKYIWVAPCVRTSKEIFLKTLYPSRKYNSFYNRGEL